MEQTETEPSTEEPTVSEVFVKQDGKGFHESASRLEKGSGDRNRTIGQWFVVVCCCFLCASIARSLLVLAFSFSLNVLALLHRCYISGLWDMGVRVALLL